MRRTLIVDPRIRGKYTDIIDLPIVLRVRKFDEEAAKTFTERLPLIDIAGYVESWRLGGCREESPGRECRDEERPALFKGMCRATQSPGG